MREFAHAEVVDNEQRHGGHRVGQFIKQDVRFAISGSIHVTMNATAEKVTVTVEDNGIGISATDLPHIFQRFYRADPSRSQAEGSGLGLAIAKWIADSHHARISVDSKVNTGSIFEIVFPVFMVGSPPPKPAAIGALLLNLS